MSHRIPFAGREHLRASLRGRERQNEISEEGTIGHVEHGPEQEWRAVLRDAQDHRVAECAPRNSWRGRFTN